MKTEFRNPYQPIGVGVKIEDIQLDVVRVAMKEKGELFPFGEIYRPLSLKSKAIQSIVALGIGKYSSDATSKLKSIISSKQAELEIDLNRKLQKLLDREGMFKEYI
jgi:hypothetical protein